MGPLPSPTRRHSLAATGICVGALAVGLGGCGSAIQTAQPSANLPNIAQIQTAIEQTILEHFHKRANVTCPAVVPEILNETFSCVGVSSGKHPQVFTFLATEGGGTYVTYRQTS